jgi:hypothetical protein
MPDVLLSFVTGPTVGMWFMRSVLMLFKSDPDLRFTADFIISMGPYIHQNRNELQKAFMETDRDWLFMVDNDMVFEPKDAFALLEEADKRGPGIYSAAYVMENGSYVCGPWSTQADKVYHPLNDIPLDPFEVGMVGTGFTLIHRKVFEAIGRDAFSPLPFTPEDEFTFFGEDVSLCWRAREAGFTPVVVPAAVPGHTKSVVMYHDRKTTNLQSQEVDLVRVDPTDKLFQRRTS